MKRYSMRFFEGHKSRASVVVPVEHEDGEWVSVADVAALEARLKEAETVIESLSGIGRKDHSNPKYDEIYDRAEAWLKKEAQA